MNRRRMMVGAATLSFVRPGNAAKPRRMKPQVGDVLAHAFGEQAGSVIAAKDVVLQPVPAFPRDPSTGVVRDGSLHNQLAVLRVPSERLTPKAKRHAVAAPPHAFLVYSAACTHTGCEVSGWNNDAARLVCPCHGSEFDVADAARVVNGPATKPLAMLKVEITDGVFRVTGGFSRRVGPEPP
ncbi:MAG: ubiquinol-cytochrome c reductase iron-sulfur subunit [Gammaproteobacteria bacterium]|nr:ubiquinol-cytochrome c reductase iron-sulfur subunit [Gammaproteobacteria bacterium]